MRYQFLPEPAPLNLPYSPFKSFNHIRQIRIRNSGSKLTDYQIKLELNSNIFPFEKVRSDGADIRFVDDTGEELNYWLESWSSSSGKTWMKIPEIPKYTDKRIWMIYGNINAVSDSNISNTFIFGDDFSGDLSKWSLTQSTPGNVQIVSGEARITGNGNYNTNGMQSSVINRPCIIEWKSRYSALVGVMEGYTPLGLTITSGLDTHPETDNKVHRRLDGAQIELLSPIILTETEKRIILKTTHGYKIFWNGVEEENNDAWSTTGNRISFNHHTSGQYTYVNEVKVRKYTATEPIVEII